ncbi:MAG: SRPBCC family protein [Rhodospirillales bacterium]|nr:SRPBCC family protein [Rhodospirillales bacterium]
MPDIEASFRIDQPAHRVWDFFQDVPEVVTCMPGTELLGQPGEAIYAGKVTVKLGPVTAAFEGEATIVESDHDARTARIEASGIDRRGGNRAKASFTYEVRTQDGGSHVRLSGTIKLSGALAQIGRSGIVQDVANHLTTQFSERLHEKLALSGREADADPREPPQAIAGTQLTRIVVLAWIRRLLAALVGRGG